MRDVGLIRLLAEKVPGKRIRIHHGWRLFNQHEKALKMVIAVGWFSQDHFELLELLRKIFGPLSELLLGPIEVPYQRNVRLKHRAI